MKWLVQNNLYREEQDFEVVKNTFERFGIEYFELSVSKGKLIPEPELDDSPIMILGGYSLMRYAVENNLTPGCFSNNMDMTSWINHYKENMLNFDSKILPLGKVDEDGCFFLRPEHDSKEFSGLTFDNREEFEQWRIDTIATSIICDENTSVVVSELKCIHRETRFFIIDGEIISASVYKINGDPRTSTYINQEEIDFVNEMINLWTPNRAFVMDVATTDNGMKIVELNCINCSGFYEADIQKIIMTLDGIV